MNLALECIIVAVGCQLSDLLLIGIAAKEMFFYGCVSDSTDFVEPGFDLSHSFIKINTGGVS